MVRDANGRIQAIVGDIPGLLCVKCVGRCFSGNLYKLLFLNGRKTAHFAVQVLYWTIYEDIIQWSFLCFQFQVLSDNYSQVLEIYKLEIVSSMVKYFSEFLGSHSRFLWNFLWFSYVSSLSSQLSATNSVTLICNTTLVSGVSIYVVSIPVAVFPPLHFTLFPIFEILDMFYWFSELFQACFFSVLSFSHHSHKVQQPYAWRIIVACMHRWHAKPFICCKLIHNLFFDF